ncbi:RagB/SusD family nutrient uptake outer membrane protein [Pedobacter sp. SD-b]|uniref:RagB/SusD family nutrient uptake outer membrane protein n=1 Tax=Pedobacter segetis TaxID=2793069 RepID=A0ABS1BME6_9SPHI|nr:RagB/SusD family nutrient uptake outer membrane protein [Pedobacter segetis]MBK0384058.1 RagB/SusD family nutrient uptake outer membrane protein [Pedobacter segetis]
MKKYNYLYLFLVSFFLFGCEKYLDKVPEFDGLQQKDVFSDIRLARNFLDGAYTNLLSEVSARDGDSDWLPAMTMGGEGYPGRLELNVPETYNSYAQGDYITLINRKPGDLQTPYFVDRYFEGWKGIRTVNSLLENVDLIKNSTPTDVERLKGQAHFLRAFFYHLITKRHGGVIYLKENLDLNGSLDRKRESYASNLANMIADLDLAINELPITWESENVGRPTKGAAMALKSRITLFAASPLVNTTNSPGPWETAAKAAADLINFANTNGLYQLVSASGANSISVGHNGADLNQPELDALKPYRNIFIGQGVSKEIPQEVIFMEPNQLFDYPSNKFINPIPRLSLTTGFDILKGNNSPMCIGALANFVSKFETKNGLAIEDDATYNPQEPFINRDPRFYSDILFNGVNFKHTVGALNATGVTDLAVVNKQGKLGLDLHDPATPANLLWRVRNLTGYMVRKWCPNGAYWENGNKGSWDFHVNNNLMRMSEIYLNYAEAANEAYGPNGSAPGLSITALQAVNLIRNRVGMPNVNAMYTGSKDLLRKRIKNERAIELCFEGFRYDDLRRWRDASLPENEKVYFLEMRWQGAVSATYPTGFKYDVVEKANLAKTFNERNYWWPIPSSELVAAPSFSQTPGW